MGAEPLAAMIRVRPATGSQANTDVLREMLFEAAIWRPGRARPPLGRVISDPGIARYIEGWGRGGDAGVVAEDESGRAVGAAWFRRFSRDDHGYGFVDASIPELTIGVKPEARRRGAGSALLLALIERARADGFVALSLSVECDNPAARLYERFGFVRVKCADGAWTMLLELAQPPP